MPTPAQIKQDMEQLRPGSSYLYDKHPQLQPKPKPQPKPAYTPEEQQMFQKWLHVFNDQQICRRYAGNGFTFGDSNVIPVPVDDTERRIAREAAIQASRQYDNNTDQGQAINKFLRKYDSFNNAVARQQKRQLKRLDKQGASAYSQSDIIPQSDTKEAIKIAAESAGRSAAAAELRYGEKGSDEIMQQIDSWLNNKMYNVYFYHTYLTVLVNDKTGRGFTTQEKETERRDTLNEITPIWQAYENSMRQVGDIKPNSGKASLKQINDIRSMQSATGGRK